MAAVWSWQTLQGTLANIASGHWGVTIGYTPGTGASVQRLITYSRVTIWSTQTGSLSGNPIASALWCQLTINQTMSDSTTVKIYQRAEIVAPNYQSTVVGTSSDALTVWDIPHDLWDFDTQVRFKSVTGVETISAVMDVFSIDGVDNPVKPSFVSGLFMARVLTSAP